MRDDDAEAARIRTLAGIAAFTLMLGLLIVGLLPDLSTLGGRAGGTPAWFGACLFALLGLAGLGWAAFRAIRLRRRTRA
ncbi:hypothetical protein ACR8AL_01155 [Clavibacter sepedonicus]|uniref:Membrane protein n=1 Tax=Clavibacter sepedonicus TaxID=31964 RepID=B0RER3_CLASE|nr:MULTISPECIES: hypothetical protein [Clavibacter]MBD5382978.1 hypothetical protein [Clavibacter sp.]OQJ49273.1 hypothetical protein B5P19_14285 [Clavibacter sepedonicus]OQJ54888.1 hypothetical protein B5P20_12865 [Clavibacter sepedonicus]UUK64884.1 hypothetical protein LRE50_11370 [Clavibacter sepedonicus]CAQ00910.1 putative membrane protein [Clavibacter sepedonicus]